MTEVKFLADKKCLYGFIISGHSSVNCDDEEGKIVCSAVSSAAYMTANTITEIQHINADVTENDGFSVVAPIRIIEPFSTYDKNASCWALLKR